MNKILKAAIAASIAGTMTLSLSACSQRDVEDAIDLGSDIASMIDGKATANTDGNMNSSTSSTVDNADGWSMTVAPNYYQVVGKAQVDDTVPAGTIDYSPVDSLGKPGVAKARITYKMRAEGSERSRDMEDPAGWPSSNPKVEIKLDNGKTYHGYMWNRSHQIAKSLGGSDKADNMVVGTRMQNVGDNQPAGGMAYTETLARDWLDSHKSGTVYYAVTPVFNGNEMLPRYSYVDMKTSDASIDIRVKVYNAANGWKIDYKTGEVSAAK